jgi:integrase
MSVFFVKDKKWWRYDFVLKKTRSTQDGFKTKTLAKKAEAKRREEKNNPKTGTEIQTGITFLELANLRLDYMEAYNSHEHYRDSTYRTRRWVTEWGKLNCNDITPDILEAHLLERLKKVSPITVNSEIRNLRALFNFGIKKKRIINNPTKDISFFPIEKKEKYVPPIEDILKVTLASEPDEQDYLYAIRETLARVNEINNLQWPDVNFQDRYVVLYTRKKKGGHRTPRKVPMTEKLFEILSRRYQNKDKDKPWVFWHRYWSRKESKWVEGPFKSRKKLLRSLCNKVSVKPFCFHALRHFGASVLDNANVNIGSIQRILGHERRTTTEIYLHSIGESEREAMNVFEQITKKSHTKSHTLKP